MKSANLLFIIWKALQSKEDKKITNSESKLKKLEISLDDVINLGKYDSIENQLDAVYNQTAEGIKYNKTTYYWWHGSNRLDMYCRSYKVFLWNTF